MTWYWLIGLGLFAIAGLGLFMAFQRPEFVAGLFRSIAWSIFNALLPVILKRKTPLEEQKWRDAVRRGEEWDEFRHRPKDSK